MVNECSSLSTGMPASVVVGGVGRVPVMVVPFGRKWLFGISGNRRVRRHVSWHSASARFPALQRDPGVARVGCTVDAVAVWLVAGRGQDHVVVCGVGVVAVPSAGSPIRGAAGIRMSVAVVDQLLEIALPSGRA